MEFAFDQDNSLDISVNIGDTDPDNRDEFAALATAIIFVSYILVRKVDWGRVTGRMVVEFAVVQDNSLDISVNIGDTDPDNRDEFVALATAINLSLIFYFEKLTGGALQGEWLRNWHLVQDDSLDISVNVGHTDLFNRVAFIGISKALLFGSRTKRHRTHWTRDTG